MSKEVSSQTCPGLVLLQSKITCQFSAVNFSGLGPIERSVVDKVNWSSIFILNESASHEVFACFRFH